MGKRGVCSDRWDPPFLGRATVEVLGSRGEPWPPPGAGLPHEGAARLPAKHFNSCVLVNIGTCFVGASRPARRGARSASASPAPRGSDPECDVVN